MGPDLPIQNYLDIGKISVAARNLSTRGTSAPLMKTSRRLENALPLAGGLGGEAAARRIFRTKAKPKAKYNKNVKIRRGGFFPLRSASRNISRREAIYRIRRIYRAEGISRAPRARKMKERKSPARGDFTPSEQPAGRSLFEAQRKFRPLRRSA